MTQVADHSFPLLLLLPAFNEAGRIAPVIETARQFCPCVLIVDDGSTDDTAQVARASGAEVIRLESNQGKGAALARGFSRAVNQGYDAVITMDSDGQHLAEDLPSFIDAYAAGHRVVVGNRMAKAGDMPLIRRWTNRFMSGLLTRVMGQEVPDTQNGFRLYGVEVLAKVRVEAKRFAAESEILLEIACLGIPIHSVPVRAVYGDEHSTICPVRDTVRFFGMLRRHRASSFRDRKA